jgi:hypothetical protein
MLQRYSLFFNEMPDIYTARGMGAAIAQEMIFIAWVMGSISRRIDFITWVMGFILRRTGSVT